MPSGCRINLKTIPPELPSGPRALYGSIEIHTLVDGKQLGAWLAQVFVNNIDLNACLARVERFSFKLNIDSTTFDILEIF